MKGGDSIILAINYLKSAKNCFNDFANEHPGSKGALIFHNSNKRIDWIYNDLLATSLPDEVKNGIKKEWKSDVFTLPAITEKAALLTPDQRGIIEYILDCIINGDEIKVEQLKPEECNN